MAWTPEKNELLYQMLKERFSVESNIDQIKKWNLARSWTAIIDPIVLKEQKQKILNELISDKIVYIDNKITDTTGTGTSLVDLKTTLLGNQEITP